MDETPIRTAAALLFEQELDRRGAVFAYDGESDRYVIQHLGGELCISLQNLCIEYDRDHDASRVASFVDIALGPWGAPQSWDLASAGLLFCLEPTDYVERPELRVSISEQADKVLIHFDEARGSISWVSQSYLDDWGVSRDEAEMAASANLSALMARATLRTEEVGDVTLGFIETGLPFKTALLLAPNFKQIISPALGWPLYAVAPDRDFLYLWAASRPDFIQRVGGVVVREFTTAPYPISTEVFEISDDGISTIGAFPVGENG